MHINNYIKNKLETLEKYFYSNRMISQKSFLCKLAMDIVHEEIKADVDAAKESRDEANSFDYSELFPDGREYVVLDVKKYLGKELGVERRYLEAKDIISKNLKSIEILNGGSVDIERLSRNPYNVFIGNKEFIPSDKVGGQYDSYVFSKKDMRSIFKYFYLNRMLSPLKRVLGPDSANLKEILVSDPIKNIESIGSASSISEISNLKKVSTIFFSDENTVNEKIFGVENNNQDSEYLQKKEDVRAAIKEGESALMKLIEVSSGLDKMYYDLKRTYYDSKVTEYSVVVSYDPNDIATSTYCWSENEQGESDSYDVYPKRKGTGWTSCKNIFENRNILEDVIQGGLVAYLVKSKSPYPIDNPRARVRIRHFGNVINDSPKDFILKAEDRIYGEDLPVNISGTSHGLLDYMAKKWVGEANQKTKSSGIVYSLKGDQETDDIGPVLINPSGSGSNSSIVSDINRLSFSEKGEALNYMYRNIKTSCENMEDYDKNISAPLLFVSSFYGTKIDINDLADAYLMGDGVYGGFKFDSIDYSNGDGMSEDDKEIVLSHVLSSEAGKVIKEKANSYGGISYEDFKRFIESFSFYMDAFVSRMFKSNMAEDLIESVLKFITDAIDGDDDIEYELKKSSLRHPGSAPQYYSEYRKRDYLYRKSCFEIIVNYYLNFFYEKFDEILQENNSKRRWDSMSDEHKDYIKKISDFCSSINNYTDDYDKDLYLNLVNKLLSGQPDKKNSRPGSSWVKDSDRIGKRSTWMPIFIENFDSIFNDIASSLLDGYVDDAHETSESPQETLEEILKIEEELDSDPEKKDLKNWVKKYCFFAILDSGTLKASDMDEAKSMLKEILIGAGMSLDNFSEQYFIINTKDIMRGLHPYFTYEEGFYYKKKVSYGGASLSTKFRVRNQDRFSREQAEQYALLVGHEKSSVRKFKSWNPTIDYEYRIYE